MPAAHKKVNLYESEEGLQILEELKAMAKNVAYNTGSSYSTDTTAYSDNLMPFVDKHMRYLIAHPSVDTAHYLANLRLMTRVR